MKKIALIGIGSIGEYLYNKLTQDGFEVIAIYARQEKEGKDYSHLVITSETDFIEKCKEADLVVEAATYEAVYKFAPSILKHSPMAILSSTALADENFYQRALEATQQYKTNLYIPHGAVMGLDGIVDAKALLESVKITTIKSPASLGRADTEETLVYEGTTRAVCKQYPRNVNVHATVAMAGLGFDQTQSVIISDPKAKGNRHEIEVKGGGFGFTIKTMSETASKVSSFYTLISAYSSIKRILDGKGIVIV